MTVLTIAGKTYPDLQIPDDLSSCRESISSTR